MTIDGHDNLIIGTEPNGLVMRISPVGEGFVLYEMGKREITSVAVAKDGSIYAAGVGSKQPAPVVPSPMPMPAPTPSAPAANPAASRIPPTPPPSLASGGAVSVSGGSELYHIFPDGRPERVWSHPQDIVYAIAFDGSGRALAATRQQGVCSIALTPDGLYPRDLLAPLL